MEKLDSCFKYVWAGPLFWHNGIMNKQIRNGTLKDIYNMRHTFLTDKIDKRCEIPTPIWKKTTEQKM